MALMLIALSASVWSGNSSLRGTVYLDANHNGMRDAGETGVPNVYVRVAVFLTRGRRSSTRAMTGRTRRLP